MARAVSSWPCLRSSIALLIACAVFCRAGHAQVVAEPADCSIDMLKRAVSPQRDGSHLPLLFALRQVRDPLMRPLFLQLAQKPDWQVQVHAVLGLGEIDPTLQIDPWLITQLVVEAQDAVVATALDMQMLPVERIGEVLRWDQLHSMARMFLLAELQSVDQPVDASELQRLAASEDLYVSGLAAAILAHQGEPAAIESWNKRLADRPLAEQSAIAIWLIDACRRYELSGMAAWIARRSADDNDAELDYRATFALLMLDTAKGRDAWLAYLGAQPSYALRVRSGTMLLATADKAPADLFDKLLPAGPDEDLIARIVDVGRAQVSGDPARAIIALLDLGHPKTSVWAVDRLAQLPADQSRPVYEYLIDRVREPNPRWTDAIAQAVQATSRLAEIDLDTVLVRLRKAEDDSALQQAILLGLFEARDARVGEAAAALPRQGSGRADSLALLLQAKHAQTLPDDRRRQLGLVACGGGRVSEILQVQAGWLYLRHTGQIDNALANIFAKSATQ